MSASALPKSVDAMLELLTSRGYLAERSLATVAYLSLRMGRPLFLEGEAGVGKTEIAKVLSAALGRKLIRLQCYEGLDVASAVYEWSSAAQMIAIRLAEAAGDTDRELAIVKSRVPGISAKLSQQVVRFVQALRDQDFYKSPGVAETIDWATALTELDARSLTPQMVGDTLGALLKYQDDIARMQGEGLQKVLKEATSES